MHVSRCFLLVMLSPYTSSVPFPCLSPFWLLSRFFFHRERSASRLPLLPPSAASRHPGPLVAPCRLLPRRIAAPLPPPHSRRGAAFPRARSARRPSHACPPFLPAFSFSVRFLSFPSFPAPSVCVWPRSSPVSSGRGRGRARPRRPGRLAEWRKGEWPEDWRTGGRMRGMHSSPPPLPFPPPILRAFPSLPLRALVAISTPGRAGVPTALLSSRRRLISTRTSRPADERRREAGCEASVERGQHPRSTTRLHPPAHASAPRRRL